MFQGAIRYEAQWIEKQHLGADGEWDPDRDEYRSNYHADKDKAVLAAIMAGKAADQCEWILVAEQKFEGYEWIDQRRWTGDWDGITGKTFDINEDGGSC